MPQNFQKTIFGNFEIKISKFGKKRKNYQNFQIWKKNANFEKKTLDMLAAGAENYELI